MIEEHKLDFRAENEPIPSLEFYKLANINDQLQKPFLENLCRNSTGLQNISCVKQLIEQVVLPNWLENLTKKAQSEKLKGMKIPRKDALWKRVLRDIRDFYRILFRKRFYSYNYRNEGLQMACLNTILKEMSFPLPKDLKEYRFLFTFVHQTHRVDKVNGKTMNRYDEVMENPF